MLACFSGRINLFEPCTPILALDNRFAQDTVKGLWTALGVLHTQGIVHGDVRVANIVRDKKGKILLVDIEHRLVEASW